MYTKILNVLILSAGRRVELVNIWKNSISKFNDYDSKIFACDINTEFAPACYVADQKFDICKCSNANYIPMLLEKCLENNINLVIPTIDNELIPLSEEKDLFNQNGIEVIVSDVNFIHKCTDKRETYILFNEINVDSPNIYNKNKLIFPCFLKPVSGSSSKGTRKILSKDQLALSEFNDENNIFQELIDNNWNEFTLDLFYNKNNILKACIPRKRIEVRNGEISKGLIKKENFYNRLVEDFKYLPGELITLQIFASEETINIKQLK